MDSIHTILCHLSDTLRISCKPETMGKMEGLEVNGCLSLAVYIHFASFYLRSIKVSLE